MLEGATSYDELPVEQMTLEQFNDIATYQYSLPTLMTEGKRFKRQISDGRWVVARMGKVVDGWAFNWTRAEIDGAQTVECKDCGSALVEGEIDYCMGCAEYQPRISVIRLDMCPQGAHDWQYFDNPNGKYWSCGSCGALSFSERKPA